MSSWTQCMRKHRERKGLTQRQLAEKADIPLACILYYEHGKGEPGLFNLVCMADALGVSLDDYIGRNSRDENMKNDMISRSAATAELLKQPKLTPSIIRRVMLQMPRADAVSRGGHEVMKADRDS